MGCWDETCALSGVGIQHGDPVVRVEAVYPNRKFDWSSQFLTYDQRSDFERVRSVMNGKYDDYGGLEGDERKDTDNPVYFFHEDMWKWALREHDSMSVMWWRPISEMLIDPSAELYAKFNMPIEPLPERIEEFVKVVRICTVLRRPLIIPPHGPQGRSDSYEAQERMAQLILEKLAGIKKQEEEWEND